ncbi:MAG TPA: ribonuclease H-like domain-containing protein, partial [Anaeromyxobacteraceae bacterium]|nr:ribonuclease H-like domain-containing protein [Anaeromyxobacteraceae bacterium]
EAPASGRGGLTAALEARLLAAVEAARAALGEGDAERIAAMLPVRERWRLYPAFAEEAAFVDVETDADGDVTTVAALDADGPRLFLRGRDLDRFPEAAARWKLLVTYNGLAFDAPLLERAFPGWRAPRAHVDLRPLWARLGHEGGLKLLEIATGVGRPAHLSGLDGNGAVSLWRRHVDGEPGALRLLAEYNLYDAVNLKALAALGYNRMVERLALPAEPLPRWERGDVLYDLSKLLLALPEARG